MQDVVVARRWDLPTLAGQSASGATADLLRAPSVVKWQFLTHVVQHDAPTDQRRRRRQV